MPCVNDKVQTTRTTNKDGDIITTHNSRRRCANDMDDIKEEEKIDDDNSLLEPWEELVYPQAIKQKPDMVTVVCRNKETGVKYRKQVPKWSVDEVPSEDMIRQQLIPDSEIRETFSRFL